MGDVVGEDVAHSTHSATVHLLFRNIPLTFVSSPIFQSQIFCSNCSAPSNILSMLRTDNTFQLEILLLKTSAIANIAYISITADTSQLEISPL